MKLFQVNQLVSVIDQLRGRTLPGKISYAFYRNRERLIKVLESVEKTRVDLIKPYAELDDKGELILIEEDFDGQKIQKVKMTPENEEAFNKIFNEFMAGEADIKLHLIPYEEICKIEIEGIYMALLQYMISEPEEFK